jgi:AraC-like DNA-binding protein
VRKNSALVWLGAWWQNRAVSEIRPPKNVTWPIITEQAPRSPLPVAVGTGSVGVLSATDELMTYRDLNVVLKRAVELARDRIGLERASIFLYDENNEYLCGTWGTALDGTTTDEHTLHFKAGLRHREATAQALAGVSRWMVFSDVPLTVGEGNQNKIVGHGWNVITPILGRHGPLGILANDAARTGAAVSQPLQVQAAIFARLLGGIIQDVRTGSEALPWRSLMARLPRVGDDDRDSLVISVVHALHNDPSLSGRELAKRFAVSPTKLGHIFNEEMGVGLVEYKNRLRIERFLTLVAPGGGNLMQAALDAGFGSYAQFHRVFRELLGATPREYITGQKEE